jgi:hypothetical protein
MARKSKVLPFPKQQPQPSSKKPLATRKVSDYERLLLDRGFAALDAVIAQTNVAADQFVRSVMISAKCNPEDGWMFNRQKMQWEKYPVANDA